MSTHASLPIEQIRDSSSSSSSRASHDDAHSRSPTLAPGIESRRPSTFVLGAPDDAETRAPSPVSFAQQASSPTKGKQLQKDAETDEEQEQWQDAAERPHLHDLLDLEKQNPAAAAALARATALRPVQSTSLTDDEKRPSSQAAAEDRYLVQFTPDDPDNPQNWGTRKKVLTMIIVNANVFFVSFFASSYLFVSPAIVEQFQSTQVVGNLGFALYCLGWAFGPLVATSVSDVYGRTRVLGASMLCWTAFHIGVARADNLTTLLVCRALAGTLGSASMTLGGACNVEAFTGLAIARCTTIFMTLAFLGPVFGPIGGGLIADFVEPQISDTLGWRLLFYVAIGIGTVWTLLLFFVLPETHHATILRWRAQRLRREHPGEPYQTAIERGPPLNQLQKFRALTTTAAVMLIEEPIVVFVGLWQLIVLAIVYSFFDGFPVIFGEGHHFSEYQVGLAFLGMGIGMILQMIFAITIEIRWYVATVRKQGGKRTPELRIPFAIFYSIICVISLFWFAGVCTPNVHWIVPIVASGFFAFGFLGILSDSMVYCTDVYKMRTPASRAALTFLRSAGTAPFPIFSTFFYHNLGPRNAVLILACICTAICAVPPFAYRYGRAIRQRSRYADKS